MKFTEYRLAETLQRNLAQLDFRRPTDIQYKAIPHILAGEDVLAIAQTGTGKTAAFAIPVIQLLHQRKKNKSAEGIKCLVMVPTRELALQITDVFRRLAAHTRVTAATIFGGVDQDPQIAKLEAGFDVLVATPGRLFDLASQGHLHLNEVEILVLDEADHMLDLGFIRDIRDLVKLIPRKRQTLFFSATINEKIKTLAYSLVRKPIRIQVSPKNPVSKNVDHSVAFIAMDDKRFFLERLIKENPESKMLVFVRTKIRAERVLKAMERAGLKSETLHGDKDQQDRLQVLDRFRKGLNRILIATDVSARGIDIPEVNFVINYDLPDVSENYVHRVGRTGRGTKRGTAVSFCSPEEKPVLQEIEEFLGQPVKQLEVDRQDYSETIDLSADAQHDLKALMREAEEMESRRKPKKKK